MPGNGSGEAVLARLWGALAREPIPGVTAREIVDGTLTVRLADGRRLRGDADAARPFALPPAGFSLDLAGDPHTRPGPLLRALRLPGDTDTLADELDNSARNLALARAAQPAPDGGDPALTRAGRQPDPLAYLEQCVVDGHPLHPCCRTRIGLSREEVLAYAPEHRPLVQLTEVTVPAHRWYGVNAPPVLTVHPWQRDHVLDAYPWLRPTGTRMARPLMSLRTLALADAATEHVKTAVDVQMTSAVRTVSPAAVHNGPAVSALLAGLMRRTPALAILPEVRAGAAIVDGVPSRSLAVLHRRMPALAAGELALPVAALAAASPADGRPIVAELVARAYAGDPLALLDALARLLLPPLFALLELGVALEAHGQNLLVVVERARPVRLLYRDLGGVRISPRRLARYGIEAPPMQGDLVSDDPTVLRTKLIAAVVSTVLAELVAVLGRTHGVEPDHAWRSVAAVAREVPGVDAEILFGPTLPIKAMTAMRLATDPVADLWTELPNPMADLR